MFELRPYQREAVRIGVEFFRSTDRENGIIVCPTGSGKSVLITSIADELQSNVLVFQPSKEILEQNLSKMRRYTDDCSAFSASVGEKRISKVTFATIGSVKNRVEEFKKFRYIIVDECHGIGSDNADSMYLNFLSMLDCKVLGLTATPFRLTSERYFDYEAKAMRTKNAKLTMLINEDAPFFKRILYVVQVKDLLEQGYLARLKYYSVKPPRWNEDKIYRNTTGSDYSEKSVRFMMEASDMTTHLISVCRRLLHPKTGIPRRGILVFTQFVEDAEKIASSVHSAAYVCGTTTKKNRERILQDFQDGRIKVLVNVGVLTTGFDFPALDTIVIGRPTLSLAMHYQIVGRALRPFEGKDAWIIDCVGNTQRFGEVGNIYIGENTEGSMETFGWVYEWMAREYYWKQLTGIFLN